MNRLGMRTILRRRLQEEAADQWADDDLNELLNASLARLQTVIMKYDPDAFLAFYRKDLTANQKFYETPADFFFLLTVELKDATSGKYGLLRSMKYQDTLNPVNGELVPIPPETSRFGRFGRKNIFVYPVPPATVVDGLQVAYCPHLTMSDDTSVPDIPLALHMAIVMRAQIYAVGETGEDSKAVLAELAELLAEIPTWYQRTIGEPETLDLDLGKDRAYGNTGASAIRNGVDIRGY